MSRQASRGRIQASAVLTLLHGVTLKQLGTLAATALLLISMAGHASAAVGRTPTQFNVSTSGEALYSIPLFTPPGTHGMSPQLALTYSHRHTSALLGVGWSIAGLSSITRCASSWAADGAPRDVRNDAADRFCLDGNKLRRASGAYGQHGAIYQTELETLTRVTSYGSAGNGPAYFIVERADGLIYEYGHSADSRIESVGQPSARAWALNQVRDRSGNAMLFSYEEDAVNGAYRIKSIDYTSHPGQGLSPAYQVLFVWENRPSNEIDSGYLAGSLIKQITRLDRIDVQHGSTLVRRYELSYEAALSSTSKSRLASVQECAGAPLDCLPATTFSYAHGSAGLNSPVSTGVNVPAAPWPIDVNGDGRDDLVYSSSATSGAGTWRVMLANAAGGYAAPVNTGVANTNYAGATPIDYNADGKEDLLVPYSGGTWWVMLGTVSGLSAPVNTGAPVTATGSGRNARAFDVNGDGREDLVWADRVGYAGGDAIRYRLREAGGAFSAAVYHLVGPYPADSMMADDVFGPAGQPFRQRVPDFNGDGRGDLLIRRTRRVWDEEFNVYRTFSGIDLLCTGSWGANVPNPNLNAASYFGDFNDDGKSDLLYLNQGGGLVVQFSTGASLTLPVLVSGLGAFTQWVILDWDSDGYDDVLLAAANVWYVSRSTGERFLAPVSTGLSAGTLPSVSDLNGDGMSDLGNSVGGDWRYLSHAGTYPDLLQSATDGFGNFVTFQYAPLSSSAQYSKHSDASFPEQDYQGALYVVNRYSAANGIGGSYTMTYWYAGARRHLQGRGFEGFYSRRSLDSRNSLNTHEYFNRAFPYTGTAVQLDLMQPDNATLIQRTAHTWNAHVYSSGVETRYRPYVSQSTTSQYEYGGAYNAQLLRTIVQQNSVDPDTGVLFDRTTTSTEAAGANGVQPGAAYVERVYQPTAYFSNDWTNWCFGRPGQIQQIRSHSKAGGSAITRTTSLTWDTAHCRAEQQILEPGNSAWQVSTQYGYDAFGNVSSVNVIPAAGHGQAARLTTLNWGASGQFPQSTTNPKSQTTTFGWDTARGLRTSLTDPNGLTSSWQYDAFGRLTRAQRPDGTATDFLLAVCGTPCQGSLTTLRTFIEQVARDSSNAAVTSSYTYLDQWDRPLRYISQVLGGGYAAVTQRFDARGLLAQVSTPFTYTSSASTPAAYTTYSYDLLGRPTRTERPTSESDGSLSVAQISYQGLRTLTTDPLNHGSTAITNALGQIVQMIDAAGSDTDYEYDAFGQLLKTRDVAGNEITLTYNVRGMKMTSSDPDMGQWSYQYFPLGELKSQTDAKNQTVRYTYDALSRPLTRAEPEGTTNWYWDTATKGIGQLDYVTSPGYREQQYFDAYGRPSQTDIRLESTTYSYHLSYAPSGLPDTLTYPVSTGGTRFKVKYGYQYGLLNSIRDYTGNVLGTQFWQAVAMNERGQLIDERLGNGLQTVSGYDRIAGWLDERTSGPAGSASVQNLAYQWNRVGSLRQRRDVNRGLTETFNYDVLDRLTGSTLSTPTQGTFTNLAMTYNAIGNVLSWQADGASVNQVDYTTPQAGCSDHAHSQPHARRKNTQSTWTSSYCYDPNGNMTSNAGNTYNWYSYNLPSVLNGAGNSSQFFYDANRQRWKQVATKSGATETTLYVGGLLEKVTNASGTAFRHYIHAGSHTIVHTRTGSTSSTHYLTTDHLGSPATITDASGTLLITQNFAALGWRRGSNWQGGASSAEMTSIDGITRTGFTGHEMLNNVFLTHMNGRVATMTGQFLSADPFVQAPYFSQSLNRYSYVLNNPLSHTDPTGFCVDEKKICDPKDGGRDNLWDFARNAAGAIWSIVDSVSSPPAQSRSGGTGWISVSFPIPPPPVSVPVDPDGLSTVGGGCSGGAGGPCHPTPAPLPPQLQTAYRVTGAIADYLTREPTLTLPDGRQVPVAGGTVFTPGVGSAARGTATLIQHAGRRV